jgi:hypothetical protein|tara:strand:- start:19105 stop:19881 length:777 start_codon:yes stop_codon:yes gene_type:complete
MKNLARKNGKKDLVVGNISADLIMSNAGKGLENITSEDITIPRLAIIQSNSPQRKKKDEKYIAGAEEGDIFNTVTGEIYKEPLTVIPCAYRKSYVEWIPREKGGGFVQAYDMRPSDTTTDPATRKSSLKNGNQLVDTAEHYITIRKDDDTYESAVLTMTSSNLTVSRKWNTLLKMKKINVKGQTIDPPSFMYEFTLSTVEATNDQGTWQKYKIEEIGQLDKKHLFIASETLSKSVNTGKAKASEHATDVTNEDSETDF